MPHRLIIVESPSKARTLSKFLGADYTVKASMGHVRDLPKSKMGVDVEAGFQPQYVIIEGKEKQIRELKAAAKKADVTLLAADPDREGEAIAWHLAETLGLKDPDRIVFHEITKGAVEHALESPRKIDRALVAAQEARRVIDRLVGYQLSPLLWKKVRTGLSAGRVQSVAVRLVVDRENEINAFVSVESWTVDALLERGDAQFTARLLGRRDEVEAQRRGRGKAAKADAKDDKADKADKADKDKDEEAQSGLGDRGAAVSVATALGFLEDGQPGPSVAAFAVEGIESSDTSRSAPLPHTTSTLQQDASTRLRFAPRRTMSIAQQLYEGVELGGDAGSVGLITYMRTDSVRIADSAREAVVDHVTATYGADYVRQGPARSRGKAAANVQDAHEAIRPTDVTRTPEQIADQLRPDQLKLYDLIWRRFVASQMSAAKFKVTRVTIGAGDYLFRASGSVLVFDGFQRVWKREEQVEAQREPMLPNLAEGDALECRALALEQHFTQPPPRYSEASLIKELEERGIGRPSTFATTIETIEERNYVRQEERRLHPTELGKTVDGVLRQHFPQIVDVDFTVDLEKRLDAIEDGRRQYEPTVREWYTPFADTLHTAEQTMERVKIPTKDTGEACPECGEGQLVVREGRFGEFVGCSRYPECKYIKDKKVSTAEPTGEECPQCSKPLVQRTGRRGPFVGCSGYPKCRYIRDGAAGEPGAPVEDFGACPDCGKPLARKMGRRGPFIGCTGYPKCRHIRPGAVPAVEGAEGAEAKPAAPAAEPTGETCPDCGKPVVRRQGRFGPFESCSGYPTCKYRPPKRVAAQAAS